MTHKDMFEDTFPQDKQIGGSHYKKFHIQPYELIWGGDHDTEDNEDYDIVSNLSCPNCHSAVDVWHPSEKLIKEYKDYKKKK